MEMITAYTSRELIKKANEMKITKDRVVTIIDRREQLILIYE